MRKQSVNKRSEWNASEMSVIAQNELNQLGRVETAVGRVATSPPPPQALSLDERREDDLTGREALLAMASALSLSLNSSASARVGRPTLRLLNGEAHRLSICVCVCN